MSENNKGFKNLEVERWDSLYGDSSKRKWAICHCCALERIRRRKELCLDWLNVQKGELILDLGCDGGHYGLEIVKKGGRWIGLDTSLDMLLSGKQRFVKQNCGGHFINGDMFNLPFKKEITDSVICIGVINYYTLGETNSMLREINRVVRFGGRLILTNLRFDFLTYVRSRLPQFFPRPLRLPGPLYPHKEVNMITLLKNNNFSLKRIQEVKKYGFLRYFTMMEVEKT